MKKILLAVAMVFSFSVQAKSADCHSWPMNMAEVWLKNQKIVDISQLNEAKTEIKLLASEAKSGGISTQVYHFVFHEHSGKTYAVITQSDASPDECSASEVNVFLIAKSTVTH